MSQVENLLETIPVPPIEDQENKDLYQCIVPLKQVFPQYNYCQVAIYGCTLHDMLPHAYVYPNNSLDHTIEGKIKIQLFPFINDEMMYRCIN